MGDHYERRTEYRPCTVLDSEEIAQVEQVLVRIVMNLLDGIANNKTENKLNCGGIYANRES